LPPAHVDKIADRTSLYVHAAGGRAGRQIDDTTEQFVETTRMGAGI
jgi:hypothetical protein